MSDGVVGECDGREGAPPPSPSQRVQLEVDILAADIASSAPSEQQPHDAPQRVVLIVTADEALSRYVSLCLAARAELLLLAVDSVSRATLLAQQQRPQLTIADAPRADVVRQLNDVPTILIVDEAIEPDEFGEVRKRSLGIVVRPFNAKTLLSKIDQLLE